MINRKGAKDAKIPQSLSALLLASFAPLRFNISLKDISAYYFTLRKSM